MTAALGQPPSDYVGGEFLPLPAGDGIVSTDPAQPDRVIWRATPQVEHVDKAVACARDAAAGWGEMRLEERVQVLQGWQRVTTEHVDTIAGLIADEMGKTMAECRVEAGALAGKVDVTFSDHVIERVTDFNVDVSESRDGWCHFKPHGVMAVIGPFNFPAHLPNGHFVPALMLGNTVVFKPSEKTPAVGQLLAELMHEAGAPPGVFNVVQGAGDVAATLVDHDDIDGVLFTGSWPVGRRILEANLGRPGRMIALEMGGNNPAVVLDDANLRQAVIECVRGAFATTGQRCSCTRRIIVHEAVADRFIPALVKAASMLIIGPARSEEPVFMGPVITEAAADSVIEFQRELVARGGRVLVEATRADRPGHFVSPGVVEVEGFSLDHDCEVFGPLVQVTRVGSLEQAIEQAGATRYGLATSIFTTNEASFREYAYRIRSGCINLNTGTAGASSQLPFGGLGRSGNHRPAAAFSVDYCAYPVASLVETSADASLPAGMAFEEKWLEESD